MARKACSSDTRLISKLELSINGHVPEPLTPQSREPYACTFLSRMPPSDGLADSTLLVTRRRVLNDGMDESITLRNMCSEPLGVTLRVGVQGDFADVFEVKEGRVHTAEGNGTDGLSIDAEEDAIRLNRRAGNTLRGASITGSRGGDAELEVSASNLTWHAVVPAHGAWGTSLHITPSLDGRDLLEFRSEAARAQRHLQPGSRAAAGRLAAPEPAGQGLGPAAGDGVRGQHRRPGIAADLRPRARRPP